ncbi:MAG: SH3 domain-containing protein [Bacteroidota bacterium]
MSKKSTPSSMRFKVEVLVILVFFLSFIIWAVSQCNTSSLLAEYNDPTEASGDEGGALAPRDSNPEDPYGTPLPPNPNASIATNPAAGTPTTSSTTNPSSSAPNENLSRLYVTIDGLNLRTGPHLDSSIITKLSLFEEVWFMNEVTDSTQKISLGLEIADEPWVKIKHKKGRVGWVYGAGVNYYRKRRLAE